MTDRSFPEAADGRPSLPMEPELWAAGCDLETARFVARQLAAQGYTLVRVEDQDALGAIGDIIIERKRQIEDEGWTAEHDDQHDKGEMAAAAAAYAFNAFLGASYRAYAADPIGFWPWSEEWWKPKDRRSDLVRAGALIAAEIDRLDRSAISRAPVRTR